MFKGGISDKFGNRYEAKWLVRQLLEVIGGRAKSLKFEGIPSNFRGFEFCIEKENHTEWHQTKINNTNANWTINALDKENILSAFKSKLTENESNICYFISQDPAKAMRSLTEKALIANSIGEFQDTLGIEFTEHFEDLTKCWSTQHPQSFKWLRRCKFLTIPDLEIEELVSVHGSLYFYNGESCYAILRDYLEENVNKLITTDRVKADIGREKRITFKSWLLPTTISEKLAQETDAFLKTFVPLGSTTEIISRSESSEIIQFIRDPDGPNLILLTGTAGAGKSGVINEIVRFFKLEGIQHVAIRIDQRLDCSSTPRELGKALTNLDESPVITLKGISQAQPSVLVIDQVDAVSEVSGRNGAIKQTVLKMIAEAKILGSVKVIVSCRTFDFENDSQLKSLKDSNGVSRINVQPLSWDLLVRPLLTSKNVPIEKISDKQKNLLCLPLNLSIFLEVYEGGDPGFSSRNDLFKKLVERKERSVRSSSVASWSLMSPLTKLTDWMSDRQNLDAPESVLDGYAGACDLLASEGLIIRSRHFINLFHESFFDYIYARSFIEKNTSIVDLLFSNEQHLFRRTQVRQILESLRQLNLNRYVHELTLIFATKNIRFHIQVAVAQWIGSLDDPNDEELTVILNLDNSDASFPLFVRYGLFNSTIFFDSLLKTGWIVQNLNSSVHSRQETILYWFRKMAEHRPEKVSSLLKDWWNGDEARGRRLLNWFTTLRYADAYLTALACEVIMSYPNELFDFGGSSTSGQGILLRLWDKSNTECLSAIVKVYFEAWFAVNPKKHPFNREDMHHVDVQSMADISQKNPSAFIEGSIKSFIKCVSVINENNRDTISDSTFDFRLQSDHHDNAGIFLSAFKSSLVKIASENSDFTIKFLSMLPPDNHEVFTHVWLEVIKTNGNKFYHLLETLLENKHLFHAGYDGADWISFSDAYRECATYLEPLSKKIFEDRVLRYDPCLKFAIRDLMLIKDKTDPQRYEAKKRIARRLRFSGYHQWCILEFVGEVNLSESAVNRLKELRRKFSREILPTPTKYEVKYVGSPIRGEQASLMTDDQWLEAINRYADNDERDRSGPIIRGGARELSGELRSVTRKNPKRFANLINSIQDNANQVYVGSLLDGLSDSEQAENSDLCNAILNAHSRPHRPYGAQIARILEKHPSLAKDISVFEILIWYFFDASNEDNDISTSNATNNFTNVENSNADLSTINELLNYVRDNFPTSVSMEKNMVATAFENVIWESSKSSAPEEWMEVITRSWILIENALNNGQLSETNRLLIKPLTPLFNHDRERCSALVLRLVEPSINNSKFRKSQIIENIWTKLTFPRGNNCILNRAAILMSKSVSWLESNTYPARKIAPLVSIEGANLLPFLIRGKFKEKYSLIFRLIHCENEFIKTIGYWHILNMSFYSEEFVFFADLLIQKSVINRRLVAHISCHTAIGEGNNYRAKEILKKLFNDEDKKVRQLASAIFWHIPADEFDRFREIAYAFINSASIADECNSFLHGIKEANCNVTDIVIEFTEKLISLIEKDHELLNKKATDFYSLMELTKLEYRNSEGDEDLRKRQLDVIDRMLKLEVFHIEEFVKDF